MSYQHGRASKEGKYDHRMLLSELFPVAAAVLRYHHYLFHFNKSTMYGSDCVCQEQGF